MEHLEINDIACIECPKKQDWIPIKHCLNCSCFKGSLLIEDNRVIPCNYNNQIIKDIQHYICNLPEERILNIFDEIFEYKQIIEEMKNKQRKKK